MDVLYSFVTLNLIKKLIGIVAGEKMPGIRGRFQVILESLASVVLVDLVLKTLRRANGCPVHRRFAHYEAQQNNLKII